MPSGLGQAGSSSGESRPGREHWRAGEGGGPGQGLGQAGVMGLRAGGDQLEAWVLRKIVASFGCVELEALKHSEALCPGGRTRHEA